MLAASLCGTFVKLARAHSCKTFLLLILYLESPCLLLVRSTLLLTSLPAAPCHFGRSSRTMPSPSRTLARSAWTSVSERSR